MAKKKYGTQVLAGLAVFLAYFFVAARPVPPETVLEPRWLASLESDNRFQFDAAGSAGTARDGAAGETSPAETSGAPGDAAARDAVPDAVRVPAAGGGDQPPPVLFRLGDRFGYLGPEGVILNRKFAGEELAAGSSFWAAWERGQDPIPLRDPLGREIGSIPGGRGWPFFMDGRMFLLGDESDSLSALDGEGNIEWIYDFTVPLTDMDAASGLVLAGFLDGTVELLDRQGKRVFFFEPGGSSFSAIYACRISRDGSRIALIAGYGDQRFLLLERSGRVRGEARRQGENWRVAYHEFLSGGFRREVFLSFVDSDRRIVFEREGGLAIYDIASRKVRRVELPGSILALEQSGEGNLVFVVTGQSETRKELAGIRYPGTVVIRAPFRSGTVFLGRGRDRLYLGGGSTIAAFSLERR